MINSFVTLNKENVLDFYNLLYSPFSDIVLKKSMDIKLFKKYLKFLNIKEDVSFICYEKSKPVGLFLGAVRGSLAYIPVMLVLNEYRRLGYGRIMLQKGSSLLLEKNCNYVTLDVFEDNNKAIELYKSEGFSISQEILNFRNEKNSFFSKRSSDFDIVSPQNFTFQVLYNTFHKSNDPWKKGLSSMLYKLDEGLYELYLITKQNTTSGYMVISREDKCLNIHDIGLKEDMFDQFDVFLSNIIKDESIIVANGFYSDDTLCKIFCDNDFYVDVKQYEMSKRLK